MELNVELVIVTFVITAEKPLLILIVPCDNVLFVTVPPNTVPKLDVTCERVSFVRVTFVIIDDVLPIIVTSEVIVPPVIVAFVNVPPVTTLRFVIIPNEVVVSVRESEIRYFCCIVVLLIFPRETSDKKVALAVVMFDKTTSVNVLRLKFTFTNTG